jgi:uncharacterized membrane protein
MSTLDELTKLKELLDSGALTQDEYDKEKAKLLSDDKAAGNASSQEAAGAGASPDPEQYGQTQYGQANYGAPGGFAHTPGTPYSSYQEDVAANKVFGIISYLNFLCLVSIFAAPKESHYARFHANQGLVLFIFEVAGGIILNIIFAVSSMTSFYSFGAAGAVIGLGFIGLIRGGYIIAMIVLAVIGIVNAVHDNMKPLPVIGGINILK